MGTVGAILCLAAAFMSLVMIILGDGSKNSEVIVSIVAVVGITGFALIFADSVTTIGDVGDRVQSELESNGYKVVEIYPLQDAVLIQFEDGVYSCDYLEVSTGIILDDKDDCEYRGKVTIKVDK